MLFLQSSVYACTVFASLLTAAGRTLLGCAIHFIGSIRKSDANYFVHYLQDVTHCLPSLGNFTIALGEQLDKAGADLVSQSEKIDTKSAAGKMVFRMLAVTTGLKSVSKKKKTTKKRTETTPTIDTSDFEAVIRDDILRSGQSENDIAKQAEVSQSVLSRFVRGERTITLPSASRVCGVPRFRLIRLPVTKDQLQ
jgi:hypothetical protein